MFQQNNTSLNSIFSAAYFGAVAGEDIDRSGNSLKTLSRGSGMLQSGGFRGGQSVPIFGEDGVDR